MSDHTRWTVLSRCLAAVALSQGCQRAEIEYDRLTDEGEPSAVVGGADTGQQPSEREGRGVHGAELGGEANADPNRAAKPMDSHDDIAELLCRDPLDPVQQECLLLGQQTCIAPLGRSWKGCADACAVCKDQLREYPYYFDWHPCCAPADCVAGTAQACHPSCPPPTTRDRVEPCRRD